MARDECSICLEEVESWKTPCCDNLMHENCFRDSVMVNGTCPLCREKIHHIVYIELKERNLIPLRWGAGLELLLLKCSGVCIFTLSGLLVYNYITAH